MNHNYSGVSNNIAIKPLELCDIEYLRNWRNDEELSKYLSSIPYITEEMQLDWYNRYLDDNTSIIFSIYETDNINGIIGSLSLYNIDKIKKIADIGKLVIGDREARGHSYAKIAMRLAIDLAFNNMDILELHLNVHEDNMPALKTYRSLDFSVTGSHPFEKGGNEYEMVLKRNDQ